LDHEAFDAAGFLERLGEVMLEHDAHTGVVSLRIHVRDGLPWPVSVQVRQRGEEDRMGFDCSGLVRYVHAQVGVSLPHNPAQQYRYGSPVSRDRLEPGDLVFFDRLRHSGIYIGGGRFIHARQTGKRVSIARLDDGWYAENWVGAR